MGWKDSGALFQFLFWNLVQGGQEHGCKMDEEWRRGGGCQVMQPWILTLPYNLAPYPGCLFVFFDEQPGYKATYNQV